MVKGEKQHVFIIGSKGIPAKYGGFETFVEYLTYHRKNPDIQYHVACISNNTKDDINSRKYIHNDAECFYIKVPNCGSSKAVMYDLLALKYSIAYAKNKDITNPIFYVLACRIGPFIKHYKKQIEKLNGHLYVNPDGHEWMRDKWNFAIKTYWRFSETLMVKYADLMICDSVNIEKYIKKTYKKYQPKTSYISYGACIDKSDLLDEDPKLINWYNDYGIKPKEYYLSVGRFVPENNYEIMIQEFIKSNTNKDFVLITNNKGNSFNERLNNVTNFEIDKRIKFVGTVYDHELLKKIRENAYGYIHGHEVGGTNPSLLEALASTDINLLLDVCFNREVGGNATLYWSKEKNSLTKLIQQTDSMDTDKMESMGIYCKNRIMKYFNWDDIVKKYENEFLKANGVQENL